MFRMRPMRKIQPRHIHPRLDQPLNHPSRRSSRPNRANNLRMSKRHSRSHQPLVIAVILNEASRRLSARSLLCGRVGLRSEGSQRSTHPKPQLLTPLRHPELPKPTCHQRSLPRGRLLGLNTQNQTRPTNFPFPIYFFRYRVTANSATILASTSIPFTNDASGIRSSFPCILCKSSAVSGNGHNPYDCTLCSRNCAESVAHGD